MDAGLCIVSCWVVVCVVCGPVFVAYGVIVLVDHALLFWQFFGVLSCYVLFDELVTVEIVFERCEFFVSVELTS